MIPFRLSFLLGMAETVIYRCMLDQVRERERENERKKDSFYVCIYVRKRDL